MRRSQTLLVVERLEGRVMLAGVARPAAFLDRALILPEALADYPDRPVAVVGAQVLFAHALDDPSTLDYDGVDIYDGDTGVVSSTNLARPLGSAVAVVGDTAIFAGGELAMPITSQPGSKNVDLYNAATRRWTTAQLSDARLEVATATVGDKAIFAGGFGAIGDGGVFNASDAVDVYDGRTGHWTTTHLSQARGAIAVAEVGTKVFFLGGEGTGGVLSDVVDVFDDSSGNWSTLRLPAPNVGQAFAAGHYVLFETYGSDGHNATSIVDVYDVNTGHWSVFTRSALTQADTGGAVGNQIIFAGGEVSGPRGSRDALIFNADTGKWTKSVIAVATSNGRAVRFGAKLAFVGDDGTVNIYDPTNGVWSGSTVADTGEAVAASVGDRLVVAFATQGNDPGGIHVLTSTLIPAPAHPSLPSASVRTHIPRTFSWSAVPGTVAYRVYLDGFLAATVAGNRWHPRAGDYLGSHQWRVAAVLDDGATVASVDWSFRISTPILSGDVLVHNVIPGNISGPAGPVEVGLYNSGNVAIDAGYTVDLYASLDSRLDHESILVGERRVDGRLGIDGSVNLFVPIRVPARIGARPFRLYAVVSGGGLAGRVVVGSVRVD